jgi:hypothetical protein
MKSRSVFVLAVGIIMILVLLACSNSIKQSYKAISPQQSDGQIYLYGEEHGVDKILDKEFELWYEYYHKQDMRHLFVELPYYTAEFLNIWMQSDNNIILDELYSDWTGTASHNLNVKEFYDKIKNQCPETIFHGTDVGHQYDTTGERFLRYLQSNNKEDSEQYLLTKEIIEQGKNYYRDRDDVYRENMMVANFIPKFDKLSGESIMGIYGAAHTGLEVMDYTNSVPCMANQLKKCYGDNIHSEDLSNWAKDIEPSRVDTIKVDGKDYKASYFGKQNLAGFKDYAYREIWCLENAYEDFVDRPKTQDVLPYKYYPMLIETGQVFVINYTKTDGSILRRYYRSDGSVWNNMLTTEEFTVE